MTLPDPREQPFMRVPDVAAVLGISESSAYEAIHAGQIPHIRVGRRFRVPTAGVWELAAMSPTSNLVAGGGHTLPSELGETPAPPGVHAATTDTVSGGPHEQGNATPRDLRAV